ncbi:MULTISPECIES: hypothetical protein [Kitasatospora]|uniref:Secreted protein n=1 Tax=Kitasatospora setae (strain ATCC 33774 / DSM 43861 / JCM 3304 / KCC A-0304 / NBRC 14216 / KM-6054) TaxID=452652 RepID=E4NIV1_KITSK|nr:MULTISPECIES: hypothetical protein [Kitasatospora]BAJ32899.1 hypothetical protein KSE_71430 [Kitasatospora setae KM-6054]
MRKRIAGLGLAAALLAIGAGPAAALEPETVTAVGSPGGVEAICPQGLTPADAHVTKGDGSPLGPDQRWRITAIDGGQGVAAWIAPYDGSPPPPDSIALTVSCTC